MLPDISGNSLHATNMLSWTCQYDGVQSISIQRSYDSVRSYTVIGTLKKPKKGAQGFVDEHPLSGDNWYRVNVVFANSSVPWTSNRIKIHVDATQLVMHSQTQITTNEPFQKIAPKPISNKDSVGHFIADMTGYYDSVRAAERKAAIRDSLMKLKPIIKITTPNDGKDFDPYLYLISPYVFTDGNTGHIQVSLPNIKAHTYELKFYNLQGKNVLEIPRINASPLIIDKRNFQQKGMYKFKIFKDGKHFDTGSVAVY
ncbi:MAG: hypothetical protein WCG87_01920 [Bacteroidota bacterium]